MNPLTTPTAIASSITVNALQFGWSASQPVLKGCSLGIPSGELWMLLGANGSGKSTLLQLLAGLLRPDGGEVRLRQPVGFVFQNPDRQLVMPTVGADVAFGLASENLSQVEIRDRVRDALSEVGLDGFERRPIYALSGGQKQRVAIAGAIAAHCEVLLLDEPTALLDPESQLDLVKRVRSLVEQRGLTALWVTHRLEELDFAHGAILLEQGQVVDSGDPHRLRRSMVERPYPSH